MRRPPLLVSCALVAVAFLAATASVHAGQAAAPKCRKILRQPYTLGSRSRKPPTQKLDPGKTYDVVVDTSCGQFTIRVDQKTSPNLAASFVSLAKSGYYDRTIFHRLIPGFVAQGGDPSATGMGGPGYSTHDPPPRSLHYRIGDAAMAKTQTEARGTSGSQFFLVVGAQGASLPPDYAFLGKVVSGLPVVLTIGKEQFQVVSPGRFQGTTFVTIDRMRVKES